MFFNDIVLHRCKRFSLRGIDTLKIKPTLKTQMVLGSNGAGKSSLLKIGFSVMPAQASDFHKGGYKAIGLSHNGHHYTLKTIFEKGSPEHVFICDDEDLNVGRTGAVQKELIREHFGMTQDIHDVLTGEERFTAMSPLRRRDWITKLSDTDFTYVLNLFSRIKKAARDAGAVVKHNNNRLVTESSKLMEQQDLEVLLNRSKDLRKELDILLQECSNGSDNVQYMSTLLSQEFSALMSFVKSVLQNTDLTPPEGHRILSMDDLYDRINAYNMDIVGMEAALTELGHSSQHYESQMQSLKLIEGMDEGYIRSRIGELSIIVEKCNRRLKTNEPIELIVHDTGSLSSIEDFKVLLFTLNADQRDRYTDAIVTEKRQYLERLHVAKNTLATRLGNLEGRLQHIDSCQVTGCPKCGHQFKMGVEENEQQTLQAAAVQGNTNLLSIDGQILELKEFMEGAEHYQRAVNSIQRFRQTHSGLAHFWGYVDKSGGIELGKDLIPFINMYIHDAEVAREYVTANEELKPLLESLQTIEKMSGSSGSIREQYYTYIARIQEITDNISKKNAAINELVDYQLRQERFDKDVAELTRQLTSIRQHQDDLVEAIRQDEIRDLIKGNQISLAMVETTLTETEVQQGIVADIRKEIEHVSIEEKAYKIMENVLSPVDGIIAEQISIYINAIIDRMNAVIARIWGYNMAIKPCDVADGDLDYRFPLYTVAEDNEIPDISKGSTSQVDIINQAFRLIVYKFLGLHGYPLYLDELGSSFDEVHRHNLVPAIKDLIDDSTYSQIFMISHYADGQNSYPNSEIIVLDDTHVNIKRSYNDHVELA